MVGVGKIGGEGRPQLDNSTNSESHLLSVALTSPAKAGKSSNFEIRSASESRLPVKLNNQADHL